MLRRVLSATLSSVVLAVLLLGLPLTVAGVVLTRTEAERSVQTRADALALEVDRLVAVGAPVDPELLGRYLRSRDGGAAWPALVTVRLPGGDVLRRGGDPAGDASTGGGAVAADAERRVLGAASTAAGVAVEVSVPLGALLLADLRIVVLVASLAAGAVAAAWALAQVQARRLVRPLTDLAARAEQLGAGRVPGPVASSGIAEVDQVAGALATSAERVSRLLAAEREFSADASHQLRTPLTALSMRLEEIAAVTRESTTAAEAQVALTQVERLTAVVEDLLHRARTAGSGSGSGPGSEPAGRRTHPLRDVLLQQAEEWRPAFARAGRRLDVALPAGDLRLEPLTPSGRTSPGQRPSSQRGAGAVLVVAAPGPVAQALAALLENSLSHGGGTTRVRVRTRVEEPTAQGPRRPTDQPPGGLDEVAPVRVGAARAQEWVVVEVDDQGPGIPEELVPRIFERAVSGGSGTGLGLALARDLVAAEGGRLELLRRAPATFGIFLRRA